MGGPVEKEEKKATEHTNPEGTEILVGKDNREEEFYFAPTAKKKASKKKGGAKEGGSAKPIKHNAETFKLFDQLKLNAPITTEDIPALLEKLQEQLEGYQQKVKEWEIKKDAQKKAILEGTYVEEKEEAAEEEKEEAAAE